jgi:hypothetical protein
MGADVDATPTAAHRVADEPENIRLDKTDVVEGPANGCRKKRDAQQSEPHGFCKRPLSRPQKA